MNDMIEFLTSKEIIVAYIVIGVAIFLCLVIFIIDKTYDKRKQRQNTRKLNKLVSDVNLRLQEGIEEEKKQVKQEVVNEVPQVQPVIQQQAQPVIEEQVQQVIQPQVQQQVVYQQMPQQPASVPQFVETQVQVVNNVNSGSNMVMDRLQTEATESIEDAMNRQIRNIDAQAETLMYTSCEPNREEATRELLKLTEELEKAERAQRDGVDIAAYETAQEENAIISLEELNQKSEAMYAANEKTQYADEGDEPISLEDLEKRKMNAVNTEVNEKKELVIEKLDAQEITNDNASSSHAYQGSVKHGTEIFSSVFGSVNNNTNVQTEEELQKTSEFLLSLKDLQSRLNS